MDLLDDIAQLTEIKRQYQRQLNITRLSIYVTIAIFWLQDYWLAQNGNEVNIEREGLYSAITILIILLTLISYRKPHVTFILLIGIIGFIAVAFSCAVVYTILEIFGTNTPPLFVAWSGMIILAYYFTCAMLAKSIVLARKRKHLPQ